MVADQCVCRRPGLAFLILGLKHTDDLEAALGTLVLCLAVLWEWLP